MPKKQTNSNNVGEWSEIYAIFKLLLEGIWNIDAEWNRQQNHNFSIKEIRAFGELGDIIYRQVINSDGQHLIQVMLNTSENGEQQLLMLNFETAHKITEIIHQKINDKNKRTFEISELDSFLKSIGGNIKSMKGNRSENIKSDVEIKFLDSNHKEFTWKYDIKSFLASPPTILNASQHTKIIYSVKGLKIQKLGEVVQLLPKISKRNILKIEQIRALLPVNFSLSENTESKNSEHFEVAKLIQKLSENCDSIDFYKMKDSTFDHNLQIISKEMPKQIANALLINYRLKTKHQANSVYECFLHSNNFREETNVRTLVSDFLRAISMEFVPSIQSNSNNFKNKGGMILVDKSGAVSILGIPSHLGQWESNSNPWTCEMMDFFLQRAKFETPSSTRFNNASLYVGDDGYKFNLRDGKIDLFLELVMQVRLSYNPIDS